MSKLDEKQVEQAHKSAAVQKDKAFEEWVSQSVLDETAEMVNGLENDPDLDDFEPSEELFQKIVGIANERGLLAEEEQEDVDAEITELSDNVKQDDSDKKEHRFRNDFHRKNRIKASYFPRKRLITKWAAMIAVTLLGVFGVSMSSQANRTFVMQKANQLLGNNMGTVVNNTNEIIKSDTTEEADRNKVEDILEIKVPVLFYLPDNVKYWGYEVDEKAKTALIKYKYDKESIFLVVMANPKDASGIYKNDYGDKTEEIISDLSSVKVELWEINDPEDEKPTYVAQWEYMNTFYELVGKIDKSEMVEIIRNIMY